MSDYRELYQQLIIDHGRQPRHFGKLAAPNYYQEGYNPLCGDRLSIYVGETNGVITEASFEGCGCAISIASASLMIESIRDQSIQTVHELFALFHTLMRAPNASMDEKKLGKLMALAGVAEFPVRVKCATLCWHTLMAAIKQDKPDKQVVSTES